MLKVPQSKITNDCTIIEKAKGLRVFLKEEIHVINRVRIKLQVIFILDLISDASLVVKESIVTGRSKGREYNSYSWPESYPLQTDQIVWKRFITLITNLRRQII